MVITLMAMLALHVHDTCLGEFYQFVWRMLLNEFCCSIGIAGSPSEIGAEEAAAKYHGKVINVPVHVR